MGRVIRTEEWRLPAEDDEVIEQEELTAEEVANRFLGGGATPGDEVYWSYESD